MGWIFRHGFDFLFGHEKPSGEYGDYSYPPMNPFKNEVDRFERDPIYRVGIVRAVTDSQFINDPTGVIKRFALALYWVS